MTALRAASTTWFGLLTGREQLAPALSALARTGEVQLEAHSDLSATHLIPALRSLSDQYRHLLQRYGAFWPAPAGGAVDHELELEAIGRSALARLRAWAAATDPTIAQLQQIASARTELELVRELLTHVAPNLELPKFALLAQAGPTLTARVYRLEPNTQAPPIPPNLLIQRIKAEAYTYLLALGPSEAAGALDDSLGALAARRVALPTWLPADRAAALVELTAHLERMASESRRLAGQLDQLSETHEVAAARAQLAFIDWLIEHVPELAMTEHFAWITGWTSDPSGSAIRAALTRAKLQFLVRFPAAPTDITPPVVLRNPRWARPFELFAGLLGMPGASEADPSELLVVVAPLLFGFMFGDVAQGAVLLAVGLRLRQRYPALALLVPGGLAAMAFGVLFGSVFAREDIMPALWLKPLAHPLVLLRVGLALGGTIILLGLGIEALQYHWGGQMRHWWASRAGLVFGYVGMVSSVFDVRTLWAVPAGLVWSVSRYRSDSTRWAEGLGEAFSRRPRRCCSCSSTRCRSCASAPSRWRMRDWPAPWWRFPPLRARAPLLGWCCCSAMP